MHIQTLGSGPDLVLIHGWAMHGGIFHELAEALSQHCRVHVVDLPGHGHSRDDDSVLEVADCAERLTVLLPAAIWIGWSLGGLIAMRAAISQPQAVRGLALISASPRFVVGEHWSDAVALQVFEQFGSELGQDYRRTLDRFLALEVHGDEHAGACLRELKSRLFERGTPRLSALAQGLQILEHTDYRAQLSRISCPNLWLAGSRDRLVPAAAMEWAARATGGRFHNVARAGHAPFISHRAEVVDRLLALIREVASP